MAGTAQDRRVLVVDGRAEDFRTIRDALRDAGLELAASWAPSYEVGRDALRTNDYAVALIDQHLPDRAGIDLLRDAVLQGVEAALIMMTGRADREVDLSAMRAGAADYLVKSAITAELLERSVRYAIERKQVESRLAQLAHVDPLTGLPNARGLMPRLRRAIAAARRSQTSAAVLVADVDGLRRINRHGEHVGDAAVRAIAERLEDAVRDTDTVARLEDDEFVILVEGSSRDCDVRRVADRVARVASLRIEAADGVYVPSVSIAAVRCPETGDDAEEVLLAARDQLRKKKRLRRARRPREGDSVVA